MRGPYANRPIPVLSDRQRRNFWGKVLRTRDCWFWTGVSTGHPTHPYGRFRIGASLHLAHRVSWHMENGHLPEGHVLDHLCRTTMCVRPDHMRAVTQGVNVSAGQRWAS
jgi:hypothetical protein